MLRRSPCDPEEAVFFSHASISSSGSAWSGSTLSSRARAGWLFTTVYIVLNPVIIFILSLPPPLFGSEHILDITHKQTLSWLCWCRRSPCKSPSLFKKSQGQSVVMMDGWWAYSGWLETSGGNFRSLKLQRLLSMPSRTNLMENDCLNDLSGETTERLEQMRGKTQLRRRWWTILLLWEQRSSGLAYNCRFEIEIASSISSESGQWNLIVDDPMFLNNEKDWIVFFKDMH